LVLDSQWNSIFLHVTDADNIFGKARVTKGISTLGTSGLVINNQFITGSVGPNILIDQLIVVDGSGTNYSANTSMLALVALGVS
jgi:hypothetical protein